METTYPAGPSAVPADLTRPSSAYRQRAWLAMGGLALFILLYVLLSGWFAWTAYHLLYRVGMTGAGGFWTLIAGGAAAFLAIFMLKALFFVKQGEASEDVEVTAAEQPRLFAFLHRLADEAGAPRPHRVYLSTRVNAAVFYDLSIANLIVPSRKNLEIGLALVNVLTLGELKAVLAHEFGHFAQRTMYVGRWVYIGQQIAAHIIAKRDALDRILQVISGLDFRIAWIGWLLSIIVWSIRSVMEIVFRLVIIAQRALGREMEFQADLVAVSLTGSDALVHALHRLNAADDAWSQAVGFAAGELHEGRRVKDVFALQTRVIEQLARVLGQPELGKVPTLPADKRDEHRVFKAQLAQPPRMWLTHPPSSEREDNCKRRYVEAAIDERSAWELFDAVPTLKERLSEHLFRPEKPVDAVPLEESLKRLDAQFEKAYLDRSYRGSYLGRSATRHVAAPRELYGEDPLPERILAELEALYPQSLGDDIERLRDLEEERGTLQALQNGTLAAPNGIIRHRGQELKRAELKGAIDGLSEEIKVVEQRVLEHHRRCRTTHLAAARSLGNGWVDYLQGLAHVLHYAEHTEANLLDARGAFGEVYAVVTADRKVSSDELNLLVTSGDALYNALKEAFEQRDVLKLDRTLTRRLGEKTWTETLEPLQLSAPTRENIGSWLELIDGWVSSYSAALSSLRLAALEQLLLAESQVGRFVRDRLTPGEAPPASQVPPGYTLRSPGMERLRQAKLSWWDRFQTADGTAATIARLACAAAIVGAVIVVGRSIGEHIVAVYNGLDRAVEVSIGEEQVKIAPLSSVRLQLADSDLYRIETRTEQGEVIESFEAPHQSGASTLVYNIAGAAPLVQWTAVYDGGGVAPPSDVLGAPRWSGSTADHVFEQPPETVSSRSSKRRQVVEAPPADTSPYDIVRVLQSDPSRSALIKTHALWDAGNSRHLPLWLALATREEGFSDIAAARLAAHPGEVLTLRAEQDAATGDARRAVCDRHRAMARSDASNPDLQYAATRCIDDSREQASTFLSLAERWPEHGWTAMAVGYLRVGAEEWQEALQRFQYARQSEPRTAALLGSTIARLRRATGTAGNAEMGNLTRDAAELASLMALESGNSVQGYKPDGPYLAYADLAQGKLDSAVTRAQPDPAMHARVLRLAAASDGASAALVRQALELAPDEGIDELTVWFALALAAREGSSIETLLERARGLPMPEVPALLQFFDSIRRGALSANSARILEAQTPVARGIAYAMAATLRGEAAPPEWRRLASTLLFAPERPYYRTTGG